jgi:hypothetical protein
MAHNQFLSDFMKMREQLREKEAKNTISKPKAKGNNSLTTMPKPSECNITLATIIEEKPKKDKVIEYLCHRRDAIMEEMDD